VRQRLLLAVLALTVVLAAYLTLRNRPGVDMAGYTERRPRRVAPAVPGPDTARDATPVPRLRRNPFVYGGATAAPPVRTAPPHVRTEPPATPEPTPETNVKLVGIVHRGTGMRAALNVEGSVIVLGAGESAEGYTVLAVDDETGARLRTPDGREIVLAPVPSP
jgi:hypothetical protein